MTEIETLMRAKMYIDKLAEGVDPINGSAVPEGDTVKNERIAKCFAYISGVLSSVIEEKSKPQRIKKQRFFMSELDASAVEYSDTPITASEISNRIIAAAKCDNMRRLPVRAISAWLVNGGLLDVVVSPSGVRGYRTTEAGISLGIISERRMSDRGEYTVILYTRQAQEFIVDNLDAIAAMYSESKKK